MLYSPFSVITMMVIHLITYCMYVHNQKLTTSFNSEANRCKRTKSNYRSNNIPSRKILLSVGFTSEKVCEIDGLPGKF